MNFKLPEYYQFKASTITQIPPTPQTPATRKAVSAREQITQWLLDKLQEESAEVIQAVSKVRRFGDNNKHPDRDTTNYQELITELEDFLAIVAALEHYQYFDLTKHQNHIKTKTLELIS
jgi:NTP pyrophosphatase (non-canonical NTP hydrolase)